LGELWLGSYLPDSHGMATIIDQLTHWVTTTSVRFGISHIYVHSDYPQDVIDRLKACGYRVEQESDETDVFCLSSYPEAA